MNIKKHLTKIVFALIVFLMFLLGYLFPTSKIKFTIIGIIICAIFILEYIYISIIKLLLKKQYMQYNSFEYRKAIKTGTILKIIIIDKKSVWFNSAALFLSVSYLCIEDTAKFYENISYVRRDEYSIARDYWKCIGYIIEEKFESLINLYATISINIKDEEKYKILDSLIRLVIEHHNGNYKIAKSILDSNEVDVTNAVLKNILEMYTEKLNNETVK